MNRWEKAGAWVISLSVIGLSAWGLSGLNKHLIVAIDKIGSGAPTQAQTSALVASATNTVQKMDGAVSQVTPLARQVLATTNTGLHQTFQNVNRKCGPNGCGTLAEANKVMAKAGDEIVQTQITERQATPHVIAAMDEFKDAASGLNNDATDLNRILLDKDINRLLSNASSITENTNGVVVDFRKVADKETADFLRPVPWWKWPIKKASEIIDITAAVARHAP